MGCLPLKSSQPILDVPDFTLTRKRSNRKDELRFIDEFFTDCQNNYVLLSLESNILRSTRISSREINNSNSFTEKD